LTYESHDTDGKDHEPNQEEILSMSNGYREAERSNRRTRSKRENIPDTQEAGSYFRKQAKSLEALANFDAKLTLNRASLAQSLKDVLVWKEVTLSVEGDLIVEIKTEASTEPWLSNVSKTTGRKQGQGSDLWSNLDFAY